MRSDNLRLLVGLHHLQLGGSQLHALDLARAMAALGHEVGIFGVQHGEPGPMVARARDAGLPVYLARHPLERTRRALPCRPAVARALTAAVREHRADLLHVYEYPLILDAFHGPHRALGVPLAATVYAMDVPRWLPRYPPLVVGTQELVDQAGAFRARPALIEPPVDTAADDPAAVDGAVFRAEHGIAADELVLLVVSRLEPEMKAEGISRAMGALELLRDERLRLVVVGDGPAAADLGAQARRVNAALGRPAVLLPGALADPRPAYAAADIALGMGGSALRSMAFARPLIALGVAGFSRPVTPQTLDHFLRAGFFGVGGGDLAAEPLAAQIDMLVRDAGLRASVGEWSRQVVVDRFSLKAAAETLSEVYSAACASTPGRPRRHQEALRIAAHRAAAELTPSGLRHRIRRAGS
ncbi:Glycosyltransferase involved in cell wall bisynthesis [Micromonospora viridifaciens]|uniref:Glycosyltransferase involved in cell wall bisynthesis n=1 Tax=Micromonospora viridifaciens TaxID=1881 RepID=A0A1C4YY73_MICVI|nr:glycosyltransferase family 4 protein [Micromonospora viridifaciens]SCF25640.1 Glycosyltransferase involved in cell wall bisynthesis [Micromonospora viridifaciens]